jgi:hypothetical protein
MSLKQIFRAASKSRSLLLLAPISAGLGAVLISPKLTADATSQSPVQKQTQPACHLPLEKQVTEVQYVRE